ncbi:hypothetical protein [Nonomuraea endophytica]|uniref:hypothetical protein n=1 Tax=Nonomuraea endophytica TaxID=714136 RepID=UPI0037CA2E55
MSDPLLPDPEPLSDPQSLSDPEPLLDPPPSPEHLANIQWLAEHPDAVQQTAEGRYQITGRTGRILGDVYSDGPAWAPCRAVRFEDEWMQPAEAPHAGVADTVTAAAAYLLDEEETPTPQPSYIAQMAFHTPRSPTRYCYEVAIVSADEDQMYWTTACWPDSQEHAEFIASAYLARGLYPAVQIWQCRQLITTLYRDGP